MQEKVFKPFIKDFEHLKYMRERMEYTDFELEIEKMYIQEKIFEKLSYAKGRINILYNLILSTIGFGVLALLIWVLISHGVLICPFCFLLG